MNKSTQTEKTEGGLTPPAPQTKRYAEACKQQAGENWIKPGKPGPQIAGELGISYPSLKEWKRRYYGDAPPQREDLAGAKDWNRARNIAQKPSPWIWPRPWALSF